jgi:hypothetical protein
MLLANRGAWSVALSVLFAFTLASCGTSDEIEVRGPLMVAMGPGLLGDSGFILMIETDPQSRTQFYVSEETTFVDVPRVDNEIKWESGRHYLVRGRKTTRQPPPREGETYIKFPGVVQYLQATHVQKLAAR